MNFKNTSGTLLLKSLHLAFNSFCVASVASYRWPGCFCGSSHTIRVWALCSTMNCKQCPEFSHTLGARKHISNSGTLSPAAAKTRSNITHMLSSHLNDPAIQKSELTPRRADLHVIILAGAKAETAAELCKCRVIPLSFLPVKSRSQDRNPAPQKASQPMNVLFCRLQITSAALPEVLKPLSIDLSRKNVH